MSGRVGTYNDEGKNVDLYIPRKCSATQRIVTAQDYASIQVNVGVVDENGVFTGQTKTYILSGDVRKRGEADQAINRLAVRDGLLREQPSA